VFSPFPVPWLPRRLCAFWEWAPNLTDSEEKEAAHRAGAYDCQFAGCRPAEVVELEGPLKDDGQCGGLVVGDTAVRDMMEVEREHEHR
jgi:hypothetical protein